MTAIGRTLGAITMFVDDPRRSQAFYGTDRPWGVRTAAFADPDGHAWELAAALPRT